MKNNWQVDKLEGNKLVNKLDETIRLVKKSNIQYLSLTITSNYFEK
jgi:tryptophanase